MTRTISGMSASAARVLSDTATSFTADLFSARGQRRPDACVEDASGTTPHTAKRQYQAAIADRERLSGLSLAVAPLDERGAGPSVTVRSD